MYKFESNNKIPCLNHASAALFEIGAIASIIGNRYDLAALMCIPAAMNIFLARINRKNLDNGPKSDQ